MKPYVLLITGMLSVASTTYAADDNSTLVINEVMQSNIDCIMDDLTDFPDSWVELYNPTDATINLGDYKIGTKKKVEKAWQLPQKAVGAHQRVLIYCDKAGEDEGVSALHTNFRLESAKDGNIFLFKNDVAVDKLEKMAQQPAPNIAYGRKTDGSDEWGYQLTPTPGTPNCGNICEGDHILGTPVFSKQGQVFVNGKKFRLTISKPEGTPEEAVIRYTTDGSEPTENSDIFKPIFIESSKVIRAKLFCDGWLSPYSSVQSYIFHDQNMTIPIISIAIDDRYLNDAQIGIFANNNSHNKSEQHDWRRPMNIELFDAQGEAAKLNQLGETRITGAYSREAEKKSMAIYAHKRFGEKRLSYEFFPDQCPGLTEYKSVVLRNAGNDRDGIYMRDAIAQRVMATHTDMDWQAWQPAAIYINGKYHCMLNIRERANEDYVFTHYNGLEDVDVLENGELKEGTMDNYNAFTAFYNEHGHTLAEYAELMDWKEYINITLMNIYFNNLDYPANNNIIWRPTADDGKWRWIAKDVDYSMGLYGGSAGTSGGYDHRLLAQWLNPDDSSIPASVSLDWESTRLFRRLIEDADFKREFIDRTSIYMGDFLNYDGIHAIWDPMYELIQAEWPKHRNSISGYNQWWPNYEDEKNNVDSWISKRTGEMYKQVGDVFSLGSPVTLTINKTAKSDVEITFNDVKLSNKVFDGKFYKNRTINLSGTAKEEGKAIIGWRVTGAMNKEYQGSELTLNMTNGTLNINPIIGNATGIDNVEQNLNSQQSTVYDLMGNKVTTPQAGRIYIQNGKKIIWR